MRHTRIIRCDLSRTPLPYHKTRLMDRKFQRHSVSHRIFSMPLLWNKRSKCTECISDLEILSTGTVGGCWTLRHGQLGGSAEVQGTSLGTISSSMFSWLVKKRRLQSYRGLWEVVLLKIRKDLASFMWSILRICAREVNKLFERSLHE